MTYWELYREGCEALLAADIENAEYDARELLFWAFLLDLHHYMLLRNETVSDEAACEAYRAAILRRAAHEPLQYLTGRADFYGREFLVKPGVLIPRYDTETLIEAVLPRLFDGARILDVCTGSGCILLTLLAECAFLVKGVGVDISDTALEVARANALRMEGIAERSHFLKSDLFDEVTGRFDVIVSNPPYIRSEVIATLSEEVRAHEPHLALDGHEDGLFFYRRITEAAPRFLKKGGVLAFEIGYDQGAEVTALLKAQGFSEVTCLRDLGNQDRVVMGRYDD